VLALAAPTAGAAAAQPDGYMYSSDPASAKARAQGYQDLRSPDARDAAGGSEQRAQSAGDLRSPDARDAALASEQQAQSQVAYRDLRSPDARDAGRGITTGSQLAATPAPVETRTVITVQERGSQTLAIVFSATALLIALLAVGFLVLARRPRARWTAP
jgi:hypothetical protein